MHNLCFEELNAKLLQICGHYEGIRGDLERDPTGRFLVHNWYGLDVADISCDAQKIERTKVGIRRDDLEHIFLLKQLTGQTQVIHNDNEDVLRPGDFVLVDSTKPADLIYDGNRSHFLSVHMPRSEFLSWCQGDVETGKIRNAQCPRGKALNAAFPDFGDDDVEADGIFESKPDFLFDLARIAFMSGDEPRSVMRFTTRENRCAAISQLLDQNLTNPDLSLEWLAEAAKMSARQLQRDFHFRGTQFSTMLNERRLNLVVQKLHRSHTAGLVPNIAQTAFASGFSDISNFNRVFKKVYGCSPSEYIAQASEKKD